MAQHYTRFLAILKKWPVEEARTKYCFGKYLRDSSSQWFTSDGKVIGNIEKCEQRLQSLENLIADTYKQKYPSTIQSVTGMNLKECQKTLLEDFSNKEGIFKGTFVKLWPSITKK